MQGALRLGPGRQPLFPRANARTSIPAGRSVSLLRILTERVSQCLFPSLLPALLSPPPPPGKLGGQDSFESIESYDSCDRLTQSWSSQSSFNSLQRVPSYDSFDSEDYPAALPNHKPKGTFKDYVRDRADLNKDKPVIPAAALAGYTGRTPGLLPPAGVGSLDTSVLSPAPKVAPFLGDKKTLRGWVSLSGHSADSLWVLEANNIILFQGILSKSGRKTDILICN